MNERGSNTSPFQSAIEGNFEFPLGKIIREGWKIYVSKLPSFLGFGILTVIINFFALLLIVMLMGLLVQIPLVGLLGLIGGYLVIFGFVFSLTGGIYLVCDKMQREEPVEFSEFFQGLRKLIPVGANKLIQAIIIGIPVVAYVLTSDLAELIISIDWESLSSLEEAQQIAEQTRPVSMVALFPQMLVTAIFLFATPLILLGRLSFFSAMRISARVFIKSVPGILALTLALTVLLVVVGWLLTLVGTILIFPLVYTITYAAYRYVFIGDQSSWDGKIDEIGEED
ncbi:MAG: hypothetical protein AAF804_03980 [Bacteroidota bacterium]